MNSIRFRCTYILGANDKVLHFETKDQEEINKNIIEPMASDGLRTIGLAYKDYILQGNEITVNQVCDNKK